jgi:hypothetical protein
VYIFQLVTSQQLFSLGWCSRCIASPPSAWLAVCWPAFIHHFFLAQRKSGDDVCMYVFNAIISPE